MSRYFQDYRQRGLDQAGRDVDVFSLLLYLFIATSVGLIVVHYLRNLFKSGLRRVPGPFLAHLTSLHRIRLVWKGGAVRNYTALHKQYGPIVRTGSNHVSISDPAAMPIIYGISSKFRKSEFYSLAKPYYEGEPLDSMFTVLDPVLHRDLRAPTAQVYSMTNIRHYEPHIDECTKIFFDLLRDANGRDDIDFTKYFNWYTFDAITAITYQSRLGFMEARSDVNQLMLGMAFLTPYFAYLGQFPLLHSFLYGNRAFVKACKWLAPDLPDPLVDIHNRVAIEIDRYYAEDHKNDRHDFLAQFTAKDDPQRKNYRRDMTNHLSKNIQAIMREAMRVHPSNCYPLERVTPPGGADICGHHIPEGTIVSMMAPLINRDKSIYGDDADVFRPERWIEADPEQLKAMDRTFFTFGHGSRACIGKNIAMMEMSKMVPQVLRYWTIEWTRGDEPWETHSMWFYQQRIHFKFTARPGKTWPTEKSQ